MIVIGVDVHKQSLTAVAVDEAGRMLAETTVAAASNDLLEWACGLDGERLWALEDCRQLTRALERELLAADEELVRVPPKLMAPERRAGRAARQVGPDRRACGRQGGSARAAAESPARGRAAVSGVEAAGRSPRRLGRRTEADPAAAALASAPARPELLRARKGARPARAPRSRGPLARPPAPGGAGRVARELVVRCRQLTRTIVELDRELEQRTTETAPALLELPGCGALTAAKLLAEIGPIGRFQTDAQLARHSGVAPLEASSGRVQRHRLDRGGNRQLNCALYRIAITQARCHPAARTYLERKQAEGKSRREAIPYLKRQLARSSSTPSKPAPP